MKTFEYTDSELNTLAGRDEKLAEVISRTGIIRREVNPDVFSALVGSIVSQQISTKAAATVGQRLSILCGKITPSRIFGLSVEEIKGCGMSLRKAGYIKAAAEAVVNGQLEIKKLPVLPDSEVTAALIRLPGVGVWTAEMLLIFSLERPDILSFGDLAIRRGLCKLHGLDNLTRADFDFYRRLYSPYGSIASLYLWQLSAD